MIKENRESIKEDQDLQFNRMMTDFHEQMLNIENHDRRKSQKVHRIKTELKLLRHEKKISYTSHEDVHQKERQEYDLGYFNKVKEIMQKL